MENEGVLEVFPNLDKVPAEIASKFGHMIKCYLQTKIKTPTLKQFGIYKHLGQVYDEEGKLVCFFKDSRDAMKEAAVYILDHPFSGHRSGSSELIGFGGAVPTVFIRTEETSGCLVSFVENSSVVGKFNPLLINTLPQAIMKLSVFHLRFGNADCHDRNTLTTVDAQDVHHLNPIDHEECFTDAYCLRRMWWDVREEAKQAYTQEVVGYVNRLDVDGDIAYLKRCGWEMPREISVPYKIYTFFLKTAVRFQLPAANMVVLAQNAHRIEAFNLISMLGDKTLEDDIFVQRSHEKIEAGLRRYSERFL